MEKLIFSGIEISQVTHKQIKLAMDFKTMFTQSTCLFALVISTATLSSEAIRLSEPILETNAYEIFGSLPSKQHRGMSLIQIVSTAEKHHGEFVRITTNVSKVCQRKGCFFIAVEGDVWARIVFEDYSFFLPTDSSGRQATLEGTLTKRVLSDELAKHYAKDLEIKYSRADPQEEYVVTASSVLLMK